MEEDDLEYLYWLRSLRPIRARLHSLARDMDFPSLVAEASSSSVLLSSSSSAVSVVSTKRKYKQSSSSGKSGKGDACIISRHVKFIQSSVKECLRKYELSLLNVSYPYSRNASSRKVQPLTHLSAYNLVSSWFAISSSDGPVSHSSSGSSSGAVEEKVDYMHIYSCIPHHLRPLLFLQHLCELVIRNCRNVQVISNTLRLFFEEQISLENNSKELGCEYQVRQMTRHLLGLWESGLTGDTLIWLFKEFQFRGRLKFFENLLSESILTSNSRGAVRFGEIFQFCLAVKCSFSDRESLEFVLRIVFTCVWELMKRLGMNEQLKPFISLLISLLIASDHGDVTEEVWRIVDSIRLNECKCCLLLALFYIDERHEQNENDRDVISELGECFKEQFVSFAYFSFGSLSTVLELCRRMVKCRSRFRDLVDVGYALMKYAVARYDYITSAAVTEADDSEPEEVHGQPSFEKCLTLFQKFAIHVDAEYAVPEPGDNINDLQDTAVLEKDGMVGVTEFPESGADEFFRPVFMPSSVRESEPFSFHDRAEDESNTTSETHDEEEEESDVEEYVEYMRRKRRREIMLSSSASPVPEHLLHESLNTRFDFEQFCMSPKSGADFDGATRQRIIRKYQSIMSSPKSGSGNYF